MIPGKFQVFNGLACGQNLGIDRLETLYENTDSAFCWPIIHTFRCVPHKFDIKKYIWRIFIKDSYLRIYFQQFDL